MRILGYLSAICLILCGIPELYLGYTTGKVGASAGLLILWFLGEILGLIYVLNKRDLPLVLNYTINSIIVGVLVWMKMSY